MSEGTEFYRCDICRNVVSPWDIKVGGCQKCGGVRIRPSDLGFVEKIVQIFKHPKIWAWPK